MLEGCRGVVLTLLRVSVSFIIPLARIDTGSSALSVAVVKGTAREPTSVGGQPGLFWIKVGTKIFDYWPWDRSGSSVSQACSPIYEYISDYLGTSGGGTYKMYKAPNVLSLISNTISGSWPPASELVNMRSWASLGMVLRSV